MLLHERVEVRFSTLLAIAIGVPVGLVAGYYRGALDQAIMRLTDAWLAFPFLILAIGLVTILGPSLTNATLAIGLGATPTYIRLTRGLVLSTNQEDYVLGARALGAGDPRARCVRGRRSAPPEPRPSARADRSGWPRQAPSTPPPMRMRGFSTVYEMSTSRLIRTYDDAVMSTTPCTTG